MSEILEFKAEKRLTAMGRFLLAVDQQEAEFFETAAQTIENTKPTALQSAIARRELNYIFSGENKDEAERLYRQGMDDVVRGRKLDISGDEKFKLLEKYTELIGVVIFGPVGAYIRSGYTPEALFYIHVENLTETANHAYDQ